MDPLMVMLLAVQVGTVAAVALLALELRAVRAFCRKIYTSAMELVGGGSPETEGRRERLLAMVHGGRAKRMLGREVTPDEIRGLGADEIGALYAQYEARMGAQMTRSLGGMAIEAYARLAGRVLPIPPAGQAALARDLREDVFIEAAVGRLACEAYHRWGMFLAPLALALATGRHVSYGKNIPSDGESPKPPEGGGGNCGVEGPGGEDAGPTGGAGQDEGGAGGGEGAGQDEGGAGSGEGDWDGEAERLLLLSELGL